MWGGNRSLNCSPPAAELVLSNIARALGTVSKCSGMELLEKLLCHDVLWAHCLEMCWQLSHDFQG